MTRSDRISTGVALAVALAACAYFFAAPLAFAEDGSVNASVSVEANAEVGTSPLRTLKIEAERKRAELQTQLERKRAGVKADVEARIDARSGNAASTSVEARADMKARIEIRAKNHVEIVLRNMLARLNAAVDRFEKIAARIDSRIEKLRSEGVDVSAAVTLQAEAKAKIAEADAQVSAIVKPTITSDMTREQVKAAFEAARAQVKAAHQAIKDAHKALHESVVALKRIDASANAEASASGSISN